MLVYVTKRVLLMFLTLFIVMSITFTLLYFMPGNPYNSEKLKEEDIQRLDHANGFDDPFIMQYLDYMTNISGMSGAFETAGGFDPLKADTDGDGINDTVEEEYGLDPTDPEDAKADKDGDGISNIDEIYSHAPVTDMNVSDKPTMGEKISAFFGFDFGTSFQTNQEVLPRLLEGYKYSFIIGIFSLILGSSVGIGLGLLAAVRKNGPLDMLATLIAVIGVSFPSFIFATLIQKFSPGFFPVIFSKGNPMAFVLPIIALSVFAIASSARITRTEMVEVLSSNFILLGKAKGVSRGKIIFNYAFRNSMIAILTIFGPMLVGLTTGSFVVEQIFGIPGMGGLMTNGILQKDIFVVLGVTLFLTAQIVAMYLIVDLLYAVVDPRIRVGGSK